MKKKTKNPAEVLRKKCVNKAKEINKFLSERKCDYCGVIGRAVHSHHIFSEGLHRAMSGDVDNLICVCWLHHLGGLHFVKSTTFSFHGTPTEALEWFKGKYSKQYKRLLKRSQQSIQAGEYFWKNKLEKLNKQLKLCQKKLQQKNLSQIPF